MSAAPFAPRRTSLPARLQQIHDELRRLIDATSPDCVAIENLFHAKNVSSALTLGHARGVAVLAAVHGGRTVIEYTPAEIKASVAGYGRAEKTQIQHMVKTLLGLDTAPPPHDAADALAVALCHAHARRHPGPARRCCGPRAAQRSKLAARDCGSADAPAAAVIAYLSGVLLEKHLQRLIVDVNGVGYDVLVPLSTMYVIGEPGSKVALRIYTHVREDALQLFGFATPLEQALFERLISVSGIGPKLALAVLSGIEPAELSRAIRSSDIARLTRIPGVGKKTAERLVVELKDRLPKADTVEPVPGGADGDDVRDDLLSALENLGYHAQFGGEDGGQSAAVGGRSHLRAAAARDAQIVDGTLVTEAAD